MNFGMLLVLLSVTITNILGEGCKQMVFIQPPQENRALINHVFQTEKVKNYDQCKIKCYLDDWCLSYNYGQSVAGMNGMCELNEADHVMYPEHLVFRQNTSYIRTENNCTRDFCTYGECRHDFVTNVSKCECRPGFIFGRCERYQVKNCKRNESTSYELLLDASDPTQSDGCRAVIYPLVVVAKPYRIKVEVYSIRVQPFKGNRDIMHPGVGFNVQDIDNFDLVYFRLHISTCPDAIQAAKVVANESIKVSPDPKSCKDVPQAATYAWFKLAIEVTSALVRVLVNKNHMLSFAPSFPLKRQGALYISNGYQNTAKYRNYVVEDLSPAGS